MPIVTGVDVLPILPTHEQVLRNGRDLPDGARVRRHRVRQDDGTTEWDGVSYEHESSRGVVHRLVLGMKRQRVWDADRVFGELLKPEHRGSRWLREQEDPRSVFEELWASAYDLDPKLSHKQMVTLLVTAIEDRPGIHRAELLALASQHGWRNRGHVVSLLDGFVADGTLREERTYGPSGTKVTARRFWRRTIEPVARLAKAATTTLHLGLLAVGATSSARGLRSPDRDRSYLRLMTDKKLRRQGLRLLRERLARLRPWAARPRAPRPVVQPPPLTSEEQAWILHGLDLSLVDSNDATTGTPLGGVLVRCVI